MQRVTLFYYHSFFLFEKQHLPSSSSLLTSVSPVHPFTNSHIRLCLPLCCPSFILPLFPVFSCPLLLWLYSFVSLSISFMYYKCKGASGAYNYNAPCLDQDCGGETWANLAWLSDLKLCWQGWQLEKNPYFLTYKLRKFDVEGTERSTECYCYCCSSE